VARIELDAVTKQFPDGTTAVRSLDLAVGDGELLVLVGPSGCGKTTALRMVAGLEEVTSGTISIDGRPVNDLEPRHRDIAMVFQSYALYPHLSVYDNMAFSLKHRGGVPKAEIRNRVSEAARILELEPYLQRKPRQLSGGQRQRVAMGRAIVRQPRAFLMDEPLSNLDAKLRVQMRAEIAQLQRTLGTTTMYVTHDQTEAMTLGSRVAVISSGVLQQVAAPQELYRQPANLFVAGFIGSPPMNLVDARLERDGSALDGGGHGVSTTAGSGRGGPVVVFGRNQIQVPAEVMTERPALERYLGEPVVVGIRPEHLYDAALARDGGPQAVIELPIRLREELGSEVYVHGAIGTAAHVSDDAADDLRSLATIVARMDPRTKIAEGEVAAIAVDTAGLHFFDPSTGASILA
jgi:multiple sugar transport system ATP-binding protein